MHASFWVSSALFTRSLAAILAPSASASDPTITPGPQIELLRKQNNDQYMGWVEYQGEWTTQDCDAGATYFQSANHWRCCGTTAAGCASVPQACANGNLIYSESGTLSSIACTDAYGTASFTVCNTAFMYENENDSSPETNVNCGVSSVNWSYYRVQPDAAKTTSAAAPGSTSAALTSDTIPSTPTISPSSGGTKKKKSSKAWIAGVVIGPLLALALIGLLIAFCLRRKKRSNKTTTTAGAAPPMTQTQHNPQPTQPTGPASPPQYFAPPQNPAMAPFGVADAKPAPPPPQSPGSPMSAYGTQQQAQQWPQQGGHAGPGGQPVYNNVPSPSMSPAPQVGGYGGSGEHGTQAAYMAPQGQGQGMGEGRHFSSELDGSPQVVNVQPKTN